MDEEASGRWTVRLGLPAGVLLGGLAVASLFRHPSPPGQPESGETIVYRQETQPAGTATFIPERLPGRADLPPAAPAPLGFSARPATVLATEPEGPPPALEKSFPREQPSSRWGVSMGIGLPGPGGSRTRTHKIADGDTLPGLAQIYLGDAGRFMEIFEANRDVLPTPDALPIGRELKIPVTSAAGVPGPYNGRSTGSPGPPDGV